MKWIVTVIICCLATAQSGRAIGPCTPAWSNVPGSPGMSDSNVTDLLAHDDGTGNGSQLYATGGFAQAGGVADTSLIAKWTGANWASVDGGLVGGFSNALGEFNGDLIVGGYFNSANSVLGTAKLARWDGTTWNSMGAALDQFDDSVWALKTFNDGSGNALYVAGNYFGIGGAAGVDFLAKYNGTSYSLVGGGTIAGAGIPLIVIELESWNDGNGDALYIGGRFSSVAGVSASRIAKWNGTSWSAVGTTGLTSTTGSSAVYAIEPWDDGSGPSLFIGGQSLNAVDGVSATGVARWDGTNWHSVGGGTNGVVWDLKVFDDGSGEALYAFGTFTVAGGNPMTRIARWNGTVWSPVGTGSGADATVFCARSFDDGSGPALYIGGSFTSVEGLTTSRVARYEGCDARPCNLGDVNCDGHVNLTDLLAVIASWGQTGPPGTIPADVNGDGVVNLADLLFVIGHWG